jgi:hypothetical protein
VANRIAKWNGTSWSALGAGVNGKVTGLFTHDDGTGPQLWIGGGFFFVNGAFRDRAAVVGDLVAYLQYMGEPVAQFRKQLGIIVLIFLAVLFVFAYALKREYWKDVH